MGVDIVRNDEQINLEEKKQELLEKLSSFDMEDLVIALHAAQASHDNRNQSGLYFLHHFIKEEQVEVDKGVTSIRLPVNELVKNPANMLHGGVTALLCDNAMGLASYMDKHRSGVTLDLHVRYHRPIRGAFATANAKVVSSGGRINVTTCDVIDEEGQIMATATGSFYHK